MRRLLTVTMALGLVITAMNFTGIFAVFTDRATTGSNDADSGTLQATADLQIGVTESSQCTGAEYSEDLITGVVSESGLTPGSAASDVLFICLKNVGVAPLGLTVSAIDVVETELDCTGDESGYDLTCGTPDLGDGELGSVLRGQLNRYDCVTGDGPAPQMEETIQDLATTPGSLGTLDPGAVACIRSLVRFPDLGSGWFTAEEAQAAQSDKVEWRYAFDGTAS